jgi:drug/metabolite transporter (DMT)-like permease
MVNKIGVSNIPPFLFAFVRQFSAGVILSFYLFILKKHSFPSKEFLRFHSIIAILLISIGNGIGTYGLQYIDSGISAILAAISPILIALLSIYLNPEDRLRPTGWIGIALGTIGLLLICSDNFYSDHSRPNSFLGLAFTLMSVIAWSTGSVWSKTKKFKESPLMAAAIHMVVGAIPMLILSLFFEKPSEFQLTGKALMIWSYLIVFGSLVAYTAYIYALKYLPATLVSIQSYINPILALILGAIFLHEKLTTEILIGAFITIIGILLVNLSLYKESRK